MKNGVFYGKGIRELQDECPELYDLAEKMSNVLYSGKSLDYKTQKLIAIGIEASRMNEKATKQQMVSSMAELDVTKEEIMDVLRVVLLTSGVPAFNTGVRILNNL